MFRKLLAAGAALSCVLAVLAGSAVPFTAQGEDPFGIDTRTRVKGVKFPSTEPAAADVRIVPLFPNVGFNLSVYATVLPGDDSHLYVVERGGVIYRIPNDSTASYANREVFLDISARVQQDSLEEGMLGLVFHPNYASNGQFYVYYVPSSEPHRSVVARFHRTATTPAVGDPASEEDLITIPQDTSNYHKAGCLQFGPDGKLYVSVGDGGPQDDPNFHAQTLSDPRGKILRINGDGTIPSDNPFVSSPAGANPAIWAYGLRNPWRYSFDKQTGKLWVGDVGGGRREEVDIVTKGGNYGWNIYEADLPHINPDNLPADQFTAPVFSYDHEAGSGYVTGQAITGGYISRDPGLPTLNGQYLFADYLTSRVWALTQDNGTVTGVRTIGDVPFPASFGQDNAGHVYVVSIEGGIYGFVPNTQPDTFPRKLSQTGLFTNLVNLTPKPGMIEYTVNAPFWSDGAIKRRWLVPRRQTKIGFMKTSPWGWPAMTIIVKHFEMKLADGTDKRLETRVLINGDAGWRGYTYRWNDAGTDADLLENAETVELDVMDPLSPTGSRHETYEFPSRGTCLACHNDASGHILGVRTTQINGPFLYPDSGVTDNQLRTMNHIGLFRTDIGDPTRFGSLTDPADAAARLPARARAYLDVNCSQCHRPNGPTGITMDLRATTARGSMNVISVPPTYGDLGAHNPMRIAPHSKERSVIWLRINTTGPDRMPPIGTHSIDQAGADLIGEWIDAGAR